MLQAIFEPCDCWGCPDHQKVRIAFDGHIILQSCLNALWLVERLNAPSGVPDDAPLAYCWKIHLPPPSEEWHTAVRNAND